MKIPTLVFYQGEEYWSLGPVRFYQRASDLYHRVGFAEGSDGLQSVSIEPGYFAQVGYKQPKGSLNVLWESSERGPSPKLVACTESSNDELLAGKGHFIDRSQITFSLQFSKQSNEN